MKKVLVVSVLVSAMLTSCNKDTEIEYRDVVVHDTVIVKQTDTVMVDEADIVKKIDPSTVSVTEEGGNLKLKVGNAEIEMIFVEGGTFAMGATEGQETDFFTWEKPVHNVTLDDYYIGKTEVTQVLWEAIMGYNPSYYKERGASFPVEMVSWESVQTFVEKLNEATGKKFHLPTEAQWEYAARGGKNSADKKYAGVSETTELINYAWYWTNSGEGLADTDSQYGTHSVATKSPNELGIYDMSGNVWEWIQDWYDAYSVDDATNPTGPDTGSRRVVRGGSWLLAAKGCRVTHRTYYGVSYKGNDLGFRLAL